MPLDAPVTSATVPFSSGVPVVMRPKLAIDSVCRPGRLGRRGGRKRRVPGRTETAGAGGRLRCAAGRWPCGRLRRGETNGGHRWMGLRGWATTGVAFDSAPRQPPMWPRSEFAEVICPRGFAQPHRWPRSRGGSRIGNKTAACVPLRSRPFPSVPLRPPPSWSSWSPAAESPTRNPSRRHDCSHSD